MTWTTGLFIAWLSCQGTDFTTTAVALHRGAYEQNAVVRGGRLYPLKVSVNVAGLIGWARAKTPARKNMLSATFAVAGCAPAAFNTAALRKEH